MDEQRIELFKQAAIESGYAPDEVELFVQQTSSLPDQPSPVEDLQGLMSEELDRQGVSDFSLPTNNGSVNMVSPLRDVVENSLQAQPSMMPGKYPITQPFGNKSSIEKYSGGINLGTDFKVPPKTSLAAPDGTWKVIKASPGWNGGSGNYVKIQNIDTGEMIGFEHLSKIGVQPGAVLKGGSVVGLSGGGQSGAGRGNSSGAHASIPYQDARGRYRDILSSPYAQSVFGG